MSALRTKLRDLLPAGAVLTLLLASSAHSPDAAIALCGLAIGVLLAHTLARALSRRMAPAFAQFVALCSTTALASMGWSWLSATQSIDAPTQPVLLLVVFALVMTKPMTGGEPASTGDTAQ